MSSLAKLLLDPRATPSNARPVPSLGPWDTLSSPQDPVTGGFPWIVVGMDTGVLRAWPAHALYLSLSFSGH